MTVLRIIATLAMTNGALFLGAMMVGGKLFPETWAHFYAATNEWQRGFMAAPIYALAIAPQVLLFKQYNGATALVQSVIAMVFISGMAVLLGQRELNWRVAVATVVAAGAVYWLSHEVQHAALARTVA